MAWTEAPASGEWRGADKGVSLTVGETVPVKVSVAPGTVVGFGAPRHVRAEAGDGARGPVLGDAGGG